MTSSEPSPRDERSGPRRASGGASPRPQRAGEGGGQGKRPPRGGRARSRWERFAQRCDDLWCSLLATPAVWVVLLLLVGTWTLTPGSLSFSDEVSPDSIAQRDYIAPRALMIPDREATDEKRRRAREEVLPVYDFERGAVGEQDAAFERLFSTGRQALGDDPEALRSTEGWRQDLAGRLSEASGMEVTPRQAAVLADWAFTNDLEERVRGLVRQTLRRGVVTAKDLLLENRVRGVSLRDLSTGEERRHLDLYDHLGYPEELREFLEAEVRDWLGLTAGERAALVDLMMAGIPPNLHPNRSETVERRQEAAAAAAPVFNRVSEGEMVVRKGDRVDAATAEVIAEMTGRRGWGRRGLPLAGTLLLLALAAVALWVTLGREQGLARSHRRVYGESLLVLLLAVLGTKFFFFTASALASSFDAPPFNNFSSYLFAVPFAALGLVAALLLGRYPALLLSLVYSVLVARMAGDSAGTVMLYSLAGSLAAIYALERHQFKQRLVLVRVGLLVAAVNVAIIVALLALRGDAGVGPASVGFDLVGGLAGGLLVAAAAGFAVPVLESIFNIATDIKLIELANTNLPLLRRLAFEAPGSFQHSLMVANLAKEGCEAVGADATLAYTGALYHDIGKVHRPDYFIENQRPGQNPHDKLAPSMSSLVLISHVKDGVELARKHHLPQPVVDVIEQHHGTRLIKYFYNRALERSDPDTEEVREDDYRYPGPKPQSKVMGVLMLADAIEAASRTLVEPTDVKVRTLIRTIMDDCLNDGQLDRTDLTLSDLRRVRDAFHRVLATIFHQRIDYPGFDFNAQPEGRGPAAVAKQARAS